MKILLLLTLVLGHASWTELLHHGLADHHHVHSHSSAEPAAAHNQHGHQEHHHSSTPLECCEECLLCHSHLFSISVIQPDFEESSLGVTHRYFWRLLSGFKNENWRPPTA